MKEGRQRVEERENEEREDIEGKELEKLQIMRDNRNRYDNERKGKRGDDLREKLKDRDGDFKRRKVELVQKKNLPNNDHCYNCQ
jgi:hypothetical protein